MRWLVGVGFVAKGLVYVLMGTIALLAALGQRGAHPADKQHAVHTLEALPGGRILLGLVAIGLTAYALMRIAQGLLDTESRGHGAGAIVRRVGLVINGLIYGGLIAYAAHGALHRGEEQAGAERTWIRRTLRVPGGEALVLLIGSIIIGAGIYTLYQAFTSKFLETIDLEAIGPTRRILVRRAGQLGYAARGCVMTLIGSYFVHASFGAKPTRTGSTEDALNVLAKMGPGVLGVVAGGLVAYGLFALVQSRYLRAAR